MEKEAKHSVTVRREPVTITNLLLTLVQASLAMLTVFNVVSFTAQQTNAVMVFASVIVSLVNATFVRNHVTPMRDPRDEQGNPLTPAAPMQMPVPMQQSPN